MVVKRDRINGKEMMLVAENFGEKDKGIASKG